MNYVVFNKDGSIKNLDITEIIVKDDHLTDFFAVAVEGYSNDQYVATALFKTPDGDLSSLTSTPHSFNVDGSVYQGFSFALTEEQTAISGKVEMSIEL